VLAHPAIDLTACTVYFVGCYYMRYVTVHYMRYVTVHYITMHGSKSVKFKIC
jgi:hypothetical protein